MLKGWINPKSMWVPLSRSSVSKRLAMFTCFFEAKQLIQATDDIFKDAGRVGIWTKTDSVTYFDDFTVTPR